VKGWDKASDYSEIIVEFNDNHVYGESEAEDCPADGSFCKPLEKMGFFMSGAYFGGKPAHVVDTSPLPYSNVHSHSAWGTRVLHNREKFINFKKETREGLRQSAIALSPWAYDYAPAQEFFDCEFIDVEDGAMTYIYDPPKKWANLADCGDFPCTGPNQILVSFEGSDFSGSKPRWATKDFQLVANNTGISPILEGCKGDQWMNAYVCEADKLGILLFESQDEDKEDRSLQPIYVQKVGFEERNKLNSMMDNVWDGFYAGQIRLSRFPALLQADRGSAYDVQMTGTPAKQMQYILHSQSRSAGTTVRVAYPGAESRAIYVDDKLMQPNQWDDNIQMYGKIKQSFCGENRFIGVQNILEFYITAGCNVVVKPRNAIQTLVRMEWSMEEFFADGGTTSFIDRLTGSLGIHASSVKIVSVYEGSLIVNYEIEADEDDTDGSALAAIAARQDEMMASGSIDLGAPVLAYEAKTQIETSTDTYTPVTIVAPTYAQDNKNTANVFKPDA